MRLEEGPAPRPGPETILIRVEAIGVNPVDTYIRSGGYGKRPLPYTPGSDAAGVVEVLGEGITEFGIGDRVYTSGSMTGAYAQYSLVKISDAHFLPEKISFPEGAAIGVPYGTAFRALVQRANATPGETVLIHGASGGVGLAAVQLARAFGLIIIGTAGSPEGMRLVAEQGAHHVLDHHAPDYLERLLTFTGERGVDLILEMLANVNLGKDLQLLSPQGRVVVIGSRGPVEINPRDAMSRDASILGMSLANATPQGKVAIHAGLFAGLENGTLRPIIGREFPLAEAARAHEAVMAPGAYGKIVLIP